MPSRTKPPPLPQLPPAEWIFPPLKRCKNAMLLQAVGASQKLTAQAAGGKNTAMTWLSSNPDVAQVSTDGTVTAVGDGETVILAVSPEGRADACYVAVGTAAWRPRC